MDKLNIFLKICIDVARVSLILKNCSQSLILNPTSFFITYFRSAYHTFLRSEFAFPSTLLKLDSEKSETTSDLLRACDIALMNGERPDPAETDDKMRLKCCEG